MIQSFAEYTPQDLLDLQLVCDLNANRNRRAEIRKQPWIEKSKSIGVERTEVATVREKNRLCSSLATSHNCFVWVEWGLVWNVGSVAPLLASLVF